MTFSVWNFFYRFLLYGSLNYVIFLCLTSVSFIDYNNPDGFGAILSLFIFICGLGIFVGLAFISLLILYWFGVREVSISKKILTHVFVVYGFAILLILANLFSQYFSTHLSITITDYITSISWFLLILIFSLPPVVFCIACWNARRITSTTQAYVITPVSPTTAFIKKYKKYLGTILLLLLFFLIIFIIIS